MKTIQCFNCTESFTAVSRDEILSILHDHYVKNHNEIISNVTEEEKKQWMENFEKNWAAAEDVPE